MTNLNDSTESFLGVSPSSGRPDVKDYGTLRTVGKINSVVGWILVGVATMVAIFGLQDRSSIFLLTLPSLGGVLLGLLVVASGQLISCFVDTERHSRDSSETLKQILEKMNDTGEKDDPKDQG